MNQRSTTSSTDFTASCKQADLKLIIRVWRCVGSAALHPAVTIMCMCGSERNSSLHSPPSFLQRVRSSRCTAHPFHTGIRRQSCAEHFIDCNLHKSGRHVALLSLLFSRLRPRIAHIPETMSPKVPRLIAAVACDGARFAISVYFRDKAHTINSPSLSPE